MILEVHFVPVDAPSTSRPQRSPPGDDDSTDPPDEDEASDQADSGEDARDASSSLTEGARSRSPRQEGPRGPPPPRPVNRSAGRYVNTAGRANMWTPVCCQHAHCSGLRGSTPVLLVVLLCCLPMTTVYGLISFAAAATAERRFCGSFPARIALFVLLGFSSGAISPSQAVQQAVAAHTAHARRTAADATLRGPDMLPTKMHAHRPLPTPCRSHFVRTVQQPQRGSVSDLTLLRQASRQPTCAAFLETRALLETLYRVFLFSTRPGGL